MCILTFQSYENPFLFLFLLPTSFSFTLLLLILSVTHSHPQSTHLHTLKADIFISETLYPRISFFLAEGANSTCVQATGSSEEHMPFRAALS